MKRIPKFVKTYKEAMNIAYDICTYDLKGPVIRTPGDYFWNNFRVPIEVEAMDGFQYDIFKEKEVK